MLSLPQNPEICFDPETTPQAASSSLRPYADPQLSAELAVELAAWDELLKQDTLSFWLSCLH
jgi:hypothetical protein